MPEDLLGTSDVSEKDGKYIFTSTEMVVEVGDTKQTSFYPQIKAMKWDNEVNFSVRYSSDLTDASQSKDANDVITWIGKDNVKVRMYEKDDPNDKNAGGFEFEFELPAKPASNTFDLTIQTKGLNFLYQDEITDDEAQRQVDLYQKAYDDGHTEVVVPTLAEAKRKMRPENVVGSYAVYHDSKKDNEYKAGKAFHLYRPEAADSKGNKTWCDLNIDTDTGLLTIIIPQKFLDEAVYPVIVDPTFGWTSVGGSSASITSTQCYAYVVTANASVFIDKLVVYTNKSGAGSNPSGKGIIFNGTTGTIPVLTNGVAPAVAITSTTAAWVDLPYSTKPTVTNGNGYRLGWTSSQDFPATVAYYDTQPGIDNTYNYATPDSWAASFGENPTAQMSMYASYTSEPPRHGFVNFQDPGVF